MKVVYSSSIANFHEKLDKRLELERWDYTSTEPVMFVGMYHWGDYLKLYWQALFLQRRKIFWCGSDILSLQKNHIGRFIVTKILNTVLTEHFCENEVEAEALWVMGINSKVTPMIFDDPNNYQSGFKLFDKTHVWMSVRKGREDEYGLDTLFRIAKWCPKVQFHVFGVYTDQYVDDYPNIQFEGNVSEERFNNLTSFYHISLRLNEFDGFSEVTAKSILLGQYPITKIKYPNIDSYLNDSQLVDLIRTLSLVRVSNPQQAFWRRHLEQSKQKLLA